MALSTAYGVLGLRDYERKMITKVDSFTASGTWTVPSGCTYAIANIRAGGGGVGTASSGDGGTSSVAFASGTVSATGGTSVSGGISTVNYLVATAGVVNSGSGATGSVAREVAAGLNEMKVWNARDGAFIVAGGAVTAGAGIAIIVGAGGTAGTNGAAGGSGYVWIQYQVPA